MKQADVLSARFELVKYGSDSQHAPSGSAVKYRASARAMRRASSSSMDSIARERHPGSKGVHMSGMGDLAAQGCPSRASASACACAHGSSVWLSRPQSPGTPPACPCTRDGSPLARSLPYVARSSAAIPPPFLCMHGSSSMTNGVEISQILRQMALPKRPSQPHHGPEMT